MKGIMFNLLDSLARAAGCEDEAWELVIEFAGAEALLNATRLDSSPQQHADVQRLASFEAPTQAMLSCLANGAEDLMDQAGVTSPSDWLELECTDGYGALPRTGEPGFGPEAFYDSNDELSFDQIDFRFEDDDLDELDEQLPEFDLAGIYGLGPHSFDPTEH